MILLINIINLLLSQLRYNTLYFFTIYYFRVYKNYRFLELKEKYGMLRIYRKHVNDRAFNSIFTYDEEEMLDCIETKYEDISAQICGECGRSLRDGESYICEECINEFERVVKK